MPIDVVIPIYNEELSISKTLETVINSGVFQNIICVNDGSSDNTLRILKKFSDEITLINCESNKGKGNALALGIKVVKADAVVFLDADLINLRPRHLKQMVQEFESSKCDGLIAVVDDLLLKVAPKASSKIGGQRVYYKKDLLPLLNEMKTKRYGIEIYLNNAFKNKKIKITVLNGVENLLKHKKDDKLYKAAANTVQEVYEISKEVGKTKVSKVKKLLAEDITRLR